MGSNNYNQKLNPSSPLNNIFYAMIGIGALTFAVGLATDASRVWRSYLMSNLMFLGLGIGATVFLVVHYLATSGWFVAIRRVPEAMVSTLKVAAVTTLLLFLGLGKIYPWTDQAKMLADHELAHKAAYFGVGFVLLRVVLFFAVVLFFTFKLVQNSLRQDSEGGMALRDRQKVLSAGFLVTFAPLFTIFAIDMIKSLEPKWFSTIFGVYVFTGFMQTAAAVMIIIMFFLKRGGHMAIVKEDHVHDMSKYMFGWSIFWAYIGFSQFMLIWYANLPEEIFYFNNRMVGSWIYIGPLLLVVKWVIPFLALLPRKSKRCIHFATAIACLVVFSEWLDMNWMIMPSFSPNGFTLGWQDIGMFIGFAGLFALCIRRFLVANSMVPVKDPYLHESEHHHVIFA